MPREKLLWNMVFMRLKSLVEHRFELREKNGINFMGKSGNFICS
jgi:hypothetical protein